MTMFRMLAVLLCLALSGGVWADSIMIGLNSYHFDRSKMRKCVNERHDLIGYERSGWTVSTYKNSMCYRTYTMGYKWRYGAIQLASGYPMGDVTLIPMLGDKVQLYKNVHLQFLWVPSILVGAGFVVEL